jgi:hypothetical protein
MRSASFVKPSDQMSGRWRADLGPLAAVVLDRKTPTLSIGRAGALRRTDSPQGRGSWPPGRCRAECAELPARVGNSPAILSRRYLSRSCRPLAHPPPVSRASLNRPGVGRRQRALLGGKVHAASTRARKWRWRSRRSAEPQAAICSARSATVVVLVEALPPGLGGGAASLGGRSPPDRARRLGVAVDLSIPAQSGLRRCRPSHPAIAPLADSRAAGPSPRTRWEGAGLRAASAPSR